jgi:hypothetical protein
MVIWIKGIKKLSVAVVSCQFSVKNRRAGWFLARKQTGHSYETRAGRPARVNVSVEALLATSPGASSLI